MTAIAEAAGWAGLSAWASERSLSEVLPMVYRVLTVQMAVTLTNAGPRILWGRTCQRSDRSDIPTREPCSADEPPLGV